MRPITPEPCPRKMTDNDERRLAAVARWRGVEGSKPSSLNASCPPLNPNP